MTDLAPSANSINALAAFQEARVTTFEFPVPLDWQDGMLLAATLAGSLERSGDHGYCEWDFLQAFAHPSDMPQGIFRVLQEFEESLEDAVARGEDCLNISMGLHGEVARLLEVAPWTTHPLHGCVLIDEVDELDRQATASHTPQSTRADTVAMRPAAVTCPVRAPAARLRTLRLASRATVKRTGAHGR